MKKARNSIYYSPWKSVILISVLSCEGILLLPHRMISPMDSNIPSCADRSHDW
jgi:hypothetical protein